MLSTPSTTGVRLRAAALVSGFVVALVATVGSMPAHAVEPDRGELFVIHAVAGPAADLAVDGEVVREAAAPKTVVGPIDVAPGRHVVSFQAAGQDAVTASVEIGAGQSVDVVAHEDTDLASPPRLTVFPNDVSAVAPAKARLVVAHTAVVPPADVRVNGEVLFSNVANGEALTLVVPGGSYDVDIVPASTSGPVVFGPVSLSVVPEQLNRVYAFGAPDELSMDAIVRTSALPVVGADQPDMVNTGDGGQASALADRPDRPGLLAPAGVGLVVVLAGAGAVAVGLRRRRAVSALRVE